MSPLKIRWPGLTASHTAKRYKADMHDGRTFYSTPRLVMRPPPMYSMQYSPCYPYSPVAAHHDPAMYHAPIYYPAPRRDAYPDMAPLESHILKMSLDEKVPAKGTEAAPPVPPPTPSSTVTEVSSPTSTTSAHYAGSESARSLEESQAPRERANSGGSFYRSMSLHTLPRLLKLTEML